MFDVLNCRPIHLFPLLYIIIHVGQLVNDLGQERSAVGIDHHLEFAADNIENIVDDPLVGFDSLIKRIFLENNKIAVAVQAFMNSSDKLLFPQRPVPVIPVTGPKLRCNRPLCCQRADFL